MIKFLLPLLLTLSLFAEATFDQVQSMIDSKQYTQAKLALTVIESNHPKSARVQYTLAQVNAGLGDLATARTNLAKAKAIDPELSFVPKSAVKDLQQVLQVNTDLIVSVKSGPSWFNYFLIILSFGLIFWLWRRRKSTPVKPEVSVAPTGTSSKPSTACTSGVDPVFSNPTSNYKPTAKTYYSDQATKNHRAEVHHHHQYNNSMLSTLATAGFTAAAVSSLMNDDNKPSESSISRSWEDTSTHSYEPEQSSVSSSWEDTSSSSRSSSWDDSSSSSSDSWSDSGSSSSSSGD